MYVHRSDSEAECTAIDQQLKNCAMTNDQLICLDAMDSCRRSSAERQVRPARRSGTVRRRSAQCISKRRV